MNLVYHKNFLTSFKKRIQPNQKLVGQFQKRLSLFTNNPKNPLLKDHALTGNKAGFRSFSVNGDIRIVYRHLENKIEIYDIGSHNQVY